MAIDVSFPPCRLESAAGEPKLQVRADRPDAALKFGDARVLVRQLAGDTEVNGHQFGVYRHVLRDRQMPVRRPHHLRHHFDRIDGAEGVEGEDRGTQARALEALGNDDLAIEDVRHHLPPQPGAGKAPRRLHRPRPADQVLDRRQDAEQAVDDALQHRADHVLLVMAGGEAEERGPHRRIPPRRPLAGQIGMEDQAFAARRHPLGDAGQHVIGIDAEALRGFRLGGGQFVAHPAEGDAAVVDGAADHPVLFRQQVTEGASRRVGARSVDDRPHRATGADRDRHVARLDRIDAEIGENAVVGADDEGNVGRKTEIGGNRRIETLHMMRRRNRLRQPLRRDSGNRKRALIPVQPAAD